MKRFELTLRGRVQGVGYRAEAVRKARAAGVTGTVWNESDGSVIIIAEGLPRKLETFLLWVQAGPPAARVETRELQWTTATGQYDSFNARS